MTHASSDNLYGLPTYIVDADPAKGSHTTITLAMADAAAGDTIGIRPGTYTEDFTFKAGIDMFAYGDGSSGNVKIVGKMTYTGTGTSTISGVYLQTNSDYFLQCTGSNSGNFHMVQCLLICEDSAGINCSNANCQIFAQECVSGGTANVGFHVMTGGNIFYQRCNMSGSQTASSTNSAGVVTLSSTTMSRPLQTTGSGNVSLIHSSITGSNTASLILAGTGQSSAQFTRFSSGTATAITIDAAAGTFFARNINVGTSNATAISGGGSIAYSNIENEGTGFLNSVTSQTLYKQLTGPISFDGGITLVDNNIRYQGPYFENLGIDYNGGTGVFTVQGATTNLSTGNRSYVVLHSKADPGEFVRYQVTANQSFIDDVGASEIIGNLLGYTTSVAITVDVPFFLYAVGNDNEDTIAFMISRHPHRTISPAAADIGAPDDAVANKEGDFWSIDNIDETLYDTNPCMCIGSFRMRMSASDDWTVQTLSNTDGIGQYQESIKFATPSGQFGANASSLSIPNGGTAPAFTTNTSFYTINRNGMVWYSVFLNGDNGADGAGAVEALVTSPFIPFTASVNICGSGHINTAGNYQLIVPEVNGAANSIRFVKTGLATRVLWSEFVNGTPRDISFSITYFIGGS